MDGTKSKDDMKNYLYFPEIVREDDILSTGNMLLNLWEDFLKKESTDYQPVANPQRRVLELKDNFSFTALKIDWNQAVYSQNIKRYVSGTLKINYARIYLDIPFNIENNDPWYLLKQRANDLLIKTNEKILKSSASILKREIESREYKKNNPILNNPF